MKTKPIPIALPLDLLEQVDDVQRITGMSKADIMRLCMRIGLVDLKAAEHDMPGIVKRIADDAGVSFSRFATSHRANVSMHHRGTAISLNEEPTPYVIGDLAPSTPEEQLDHSIATLQSQVNDDLAKHRAKKTRKA